MALQPAASRVRVTSVLLVDDDQDTLDLYSQYLRFSGLRVWTAATAGAALSTAREHHPDVVVTDISLPGDDGWSLCRSLRDDVATRGAGVIALTGWVHDSQLTSRAAEAGVDLVVTKPCLPDALLSRIVEVLRWSLLLQGRRGDAIARARVLRARSDRLTDKSTAIDKRLRRKRSR
jgi:two-component system, cell cycle response regulator DivK